MMPRSSEEHAILDRLAAAFARIDEVPADVLAAANQACQQAEPTDIPRLELLRDNAMEPLAAATRGPADGRLLRFGGTELRIDLDIEHWRTVRLTGLLRANRRLVGGRVMVRMPASTVCVIVDEIGRFSSEDLPSGPLSLAIYESANAEPIAVTPWFVG